MMTCTLCKINTAVVFITKITDGKQTSEGLCLPCARKQGIQPINQLLEQTGVTDEELDNLNNQMSSFMDGMDPSFFGGNPMMTSGNGKNEPVGGAGKGNPLFNMFSKAFGDAMMKGPQGSNALPGPNGANGSSDGVEESREDRDGKNSTRTRTGDKRNGRKKKFLDLYGNNLTDKAALGLIDRVIGRSREIDRVVQILNRRTKNNPVLIGEPGVGKTAIAEGLAVRIAERQVPAKLFNAEVYLLDMTGIVAGTQFRGQFESRMKGLIDEVKSLGNIILVIDELHNIMGAGEAEGAMNAANILKPALSKGEIQVIGATTLNEYRKHIEKDSALERRFQPVLVDEPSVEDTIEILKGIRGYYEDYHKVSISDEVVEKAVILAERYITDRFLPDKAIDVIDEAGSRANLKNEGLVELEALKGELRTVQEEKETAVSADSIEDYQKAADLKVHECRLLKDIRELEEKSRDVEITVDDIADVIEAWTKIPVQRLTEVETEKLLNLEERLHKRIIGQHPAVVSVSKAIRRNRAGFRKKKKPSSFIFVGPTGVGKTELVRALAAELFESEEALIRLDMSEYMEKHNVSKLIGAPPGYVGYDEGGQLTEKIRRKPYSVILLDEIEKAHPDVFNMLLQILEDGRLTDSHGRVVSFENTVIIMTSNAGTARTNGIGFVENEYKSAENKAQNAMKELFRPEFLNRIDEIVLFTELSKEELKAIVSLMLDEVRAELKSKDMTLEVEDAAVEYLVEHGYDSKFGARPLRRAIQRYVEDELTELYMKGRYGAGSLVRVTCEEGNLKFR